MDATSVSEKQEDVQPVKKTEYEKAIERVEKSPLARFIKEEKTA